MSGSSFGGGASAGISQYGEESGAPGSHAGAHEGDVLVRVLDLDRLLALRVLADVIDAGGDEDGQMLPQVAALALARDVDRPDFRRRAAFLRGRVFARREAEIFFVDRHRDRILAEPRELGR